MTLTAAVSVTLTFIIFIIAERLGDAPMPDDMKIFHLNIIAILWIATAIVYDMKKK